MAADFLQLIEQSAAVWAYGLIVFAALIEYLFPPFPGDTIVLFAVFLAARAQLEWPLVLLAATGGAVLGGVAAWAFGMWLANKETKWPKLLRTERALRGLDAVRHGYARHGAAYLLANRFLPAFRAFFFVGAGLSRMAFAKVVLYGGVSALAWNALLVFAGYAVEDNWPLLQRLLQQYSVAVLVAVFVFVFGWWLLREQR